ncbi:MAG: 5-formyltetrahydrofolate cyclo-ligase [Burkholderiaceae bacterium]
MKQRLMTSISRTNAEQRHRRELRNVLIARRQALTPAQRLAADAAIAARVDTLLADHVPAVLAVYWPIRGEPELRDAWLRWRAAGWTLALPRVSEADRTLEFGRWIPGGALRVDRFEIPVPEPFEPLLPDHVLAPCVGFDMRCYRLGYGGGFYDRTHVKLPQARFIGVSYDFCEIDCFDNQAHDRPMQAIVTESRTLLSPVRLR